MLRTLSAKYGESTKKQTLRLYSSLVEQINFVMFAKGLSYIIYLSITSSITLHTLASKGLLYYYTAITHQTTESSMIIIYNADLYVFMNKLCFSQRYRQVFQILSRYSSSYLNACKWYENRNYTKPKLELNLSQTASVFKQPI